MAQPATNPKIEELRLKLRADPKSRLFYQLGEELRRAGQFDEAEKVLRSGLTVYPTYLAAWVSLGRDLREKRDDAGAVDALNKALQLDPGNVVAARLLADAYYSLGEKVEAIKKYKLVHALLPSDETLEAQIAQIQRELDPISVAPPDEEPALPPEPSVPEQPSPAYEDSPFDRTVPPFAQAAKIMGEVTPSGPETADDEPMGLAHEESPFEDPVARYGEASMEIEAPAGMHVAAAPVVAEVPAPVPEDLPSVELPVVQASPVHSEVSEVVPDLPEALPFDEMPESSPGGDAANTVTMADLYAKQGLVEDARHIYEDILSREPQNVEVRAKLDDISPRTNPKIAKLEGWLARVSRREVGRV